MPTYEYECSKCSYAFEKFQSMTARPLRRCPKCGGRVRRLIGAGSGVIFKGSGFYETDYKRKRSGGSSESKKSEGSTKSSDSSAKSGEGGSAKPAKASE